jgi:hypothetical protein
MTANTKAKTVPSWTCLFIRRAGRRRLALAALWCWPRCRPGRAADRDQPMNIEADALRHDDQQQPVFTGNVVVTKGTIVMRGAAGGAPGRRGLPAA